MSAYLEKDVNFHSVAFGFEVTVKQPSEHARRKVWQSLCYIAKMNLRIFVLFLFETLFHRNCFNIRQYSKMFTLWLWLLTRWHYWSFLLNPTIVKNILNLSPNLTFGCAYHRYLFKMVLNILLYFLLVMLIAFKESCTFLVWAIAVEKCAFCCSLITLNLCYLTKALQTLSCVSHSHTVWFNVLVETKTSL